MVFYPMYKCLSLFFFVMSYVLFVLGMFFMTQTSVMMVEWSLMNMNSVAVNFTLILDWMSWFFSSVVCFISSMVLLYSISYMEEDSNLNRFVILLVLFILSMLMLIFSPNLISILLGWDGLGLISYCLIIYYQNKSSYKAGFVTVLMNRIGDTAVIISICLMLNFGSWHFLCYEAYFEMHFIILFIILACFTKSAQIPFSSWLPVAMAAPTPVSALVHSSTLVTAGVYLMIRFSNVLMNFNCKMFIYFSLITMFLAGVFALFEYDMKKIIALSTLSQLGLMMSCIFLGYPSLCFFHLLTHALFKSLMFLCSGIIIHSQMGNQDIRFMGSLIISNPFMSTCFCISSFSLSAMPFMSGYYSKDLILEFVSMSNYNILVLIFFYISTILTVIYTFRMIYYFLINNVCSIKMFYSNQELDFMSLSIFMISCVSIMGGSFLSWLLLINPTLIILPTFIKYMPLIMVVLGSWIGLEYSYLFYSKSLSSLSMSYKSSLGHMLFMLDVSQVITFFSLKSATMFCFIMDQGWLEEWSSSNILKFLFLSISYLYSMNFNSIKLFMFWVLFFISFLILWS
nr:NADH dehydrogenase subunit 5 [Peloridium hammoniorum]